MANITSDMMVDRLESMRGQPLAEEDRDEIILWNKGRSLANVTAQYGWDVVLEMLRSYPEKAIQELLATDPASKDDVLANHAVAFAAHRLYNNFVADVKNAIAASMNTPAIVKQQLRANPGPIESTF